MSQQKNSIRVDISDKWKHKDNSWKLNFPEIEAL